MRRLSEVKRTLDESQKTINEYFDQLKIVVDTLDKFGVTDDSMKHPLDRSNFYDGASGSLVECLSRGGGCLKEAVDLCNVLNSMEQPKKWGIFKRKPTDETVQSILRRIISLFFSATS